MASAIGKESKSPSASERFKEMLQKSGAMMKAITKNAAPAKAAPAQSIGSKIPKSKP